MADTPGGARHDCDFAIKLIQSVSPCGFCECQGRGWFNLECGSETGLPNQHITCNMPIRFVTTWTDLAAEGAVGHVARSAGPPDAMFSMQGVIVKKMPLEGVRVLDISSFYAAPFAATLLGDFGAEVIKVEPPEGDGMRGTFMWTLVGRNKIAHPRSAPAGRLRSVSNSWPKATC